MTPVGNLTDTGTIAFTDVDLTDVHMYRRRHAVGGALGTLTAVKNTTPPARAWAAQLTWNYTVAASAVEYLAKDQTKVETFTITLDDGNGGVITKHIDVTITGTNDAPVVTATGRDRRGDRAGDAGRRSDRHRHDRLHRRRPDRRAPGVSAARRRRGRWAALTARSDTDTTGTGLGGRLTWNYTVADAAVEYLAEGQTKVETFTITLDDQQRRHCHRSHVTITGTNDAPVVTAQDVTGAVTELVTPVGRPDRHRHDRLHRRRPDRRAQVSASGTPVGRRWAR